jgi:hypothetical protein
MGLDSVEILFRIEKELDLTFSNDETHTFFDEYSEPFRSRWGTGYDVTVESELRWVTLEWTIDRCAVNEPRAAAPARLSPQAEILAAAH